MLITADHGQQNRRHGLSFASLRAASSVSAARSAKGTSSAAGRAIRTTSYRIPSPCSGESGPRIRSLATSRIRRRARFRSTEPLTLRLTATPTRLSSASPGTAKATSVRPVYTRLPPIAAWKSDCRRSRKRRFTRVRNRLGSQAVAPLATAVLDQSGAALGGHAAEKAVHSPAVALLGLIGSFDGGIPCAWSRMEPR